MCMDISNVQFFSTLVTLDFMIINLFFWQPFTTLSQLGIPDSMPAFLLLGSQKPAFFGPGRGLKGEADEKLHENWVFQWKIHMISHDHMYNFSGFDVV